MTEQIVTEKQTVIVLGGGANSVVLDGRTIAAINDNRPAHVNTAVSNPVQVAVQPVVVNVAPTAGLQGPPGEGDVRYTHDQSVAASTWTIAHNLGKVPSVTIVTSAGDVVYGDVRAIDLNTVEAKFSAPFAGKAYLN